MRSMLQNPNDKYDVTADTIVSALDALLVINELNASSNAASRRAVTMTSNDSAGEADQGMSDDLLATLAGDIQSSQRRRRTTNADVAEGALENEEQLDRVFAVWA